MAKYLVLWEVDVSRTPEDPKAKKEQWLGMLAQMKKHLKEGIVKDYGEYSETTRGYLIFEGSVVELNTYLAAWIPFVKFKVHDTLTVDELIKATKALPDG